MTALQTNSYKYLLQQACGNLPYFNNTWSSKLVGGTLGLMADCLISAAQQAFYARLPGHPQQAPDSLTAAGADTDLIQFRGESQAAYGARVQNRWNDYAQGGTGIQMINVINQWGNAGWPTHWTDLTVSSNFVESGNPTSWTFTLTIPYGNIVPAWQPWLVGSGYTVGETGLYVGVGESSDLPMLLYLVKKWKRSASIGYVVVYYSVSSYVTFTVG
jgi:hypothetical protein